MTKIKFLRRLTKRLVAMAVVAFIYWPLAALFLVSSFYDVIRQKKKDKLAVFKQYYLINGTLTWLFSPLNMLIDIICLPYINKQIYKLEDLPGIHQQEIRTIMEECPKKQIVDALAELNAADERTMIFYKWYGFNVDSKYPCPLFHRNFKRVLTIGVSSFRANCETSLHFGWLRAGVRVLFNIDEDIGEGAYIEVNDQRHVWKTDGPLFIFDDTVLHKSFNLTNQNRNCLFIDVTRPSLVPFLINSTIKSLGFVSTHVPGFNRLSNWKVVR